MKGKAEFPIEISVERVCAFLNTQKDSPMYGEILEKMEEMLPQAYEKIKPIALFAVGELEGYGIEDGRGLAHEVLYAIFSIGRGMEEWSSTLFRERDYLGGILADAMADDYLFQMDEAYKGCVIELCREKGRGIAGRAEASRDLPMSVQKKAYDATEARKEGIGIREGFMYDPIKTLCQVYLLDDGMQGFYPEHDCGGCEDLACRHRKLSDVLVTVEARGWKRKIHLRRQESLLEAFQRRSISFSAPCGGKGACGKCKVRFLEGEVLASSEDEERLTPEELAQGWRLACRAYPVRDCHVFLEQGEENFWVLADGHPETSERPGGRKPEKKEYGIAVDIGTTTIAMQLVELSSGKIVDGYTAVNRQRSYGADVISRIEASNSGKGALLMASVREDLGRGIRKLTGDHAVRVSRMAVSANSTMVHLLMGYSCETLGIYPFTPVNLDAIHLAYEDLFEDGGQSMEIVIFPGISTYVGGDIVSGLYALDAGKREKPFMLIDLGTNGEIAVGGGKGILAVSAAAGPAFEGGNIVCGTGSVPGAICHVSIEEGQAKTVVIGDAGTAGNIEPLGICGTGVLEAVCELKRAGLMDEAGRLREPWLEEGFPLSAEKNIRLYQKDIREFQLAKSAVRAGMEALLLQYGITYQEIENIYIAGGFGHQLDIQKAVEIGLFPGGCKDQLEVVGNISLKGAVKCLLSSEGEQEMRQIVESAKEYALSGSREFQELYMEHLSFE